MAYWANRIVTGDVDGLSRNCRWCGEEAGSPPGWSRLHHAESPGADCRGRPTPRSNHSARMRRCQGPIPSAAVGTDYGRLDFAYDAPPSVLDDLAQGPSGTAAISWRSWPTTPLLWKDWRTASSGIDRRVSYPAERRDQFDTALPQTTEYASALRREGSVTGSRVQADSRRNGARDEAIARPSSKGRRRSQKIVSRKARQTEAGRRPLSARRAHGQVHPSPVAASIEYSVGPFGAPSAGTSSTDHRQPAASAIAVRPVSSTPADEVT